jgi:HEAT repeat protein
MEAKIQCLASLAIAALACSGCADGPVPEMRSLNPWIRRQWADDEQFGPTYHKKVADLAALRSSTARLAPDDQERIAAELAGRLKDEPSAAMRIELARALGSLPTATAQAALAAAMSDENTQVRVVACQGLGKRPSQQSLQALGAAVAGDANLDVRIAAAKELGRFNDPAAAQALRPALDDGDAAVQGIAMQSLRGLTGKREYANSVVAWREYLDGGNPTPPPAPTLAETLMKYRYW